MRSTVKRLLSIALCLMLALAPTLYALGEADTIYREGDTGDEILAAQQRLKELGYYHSEPNGVYDAAMREAVRAFQLSNSLLETGELDKATRRVLMSDAAVEYEVLTFDWSQWDFGLSPDATADAALYASSGEVMAAGDVWTITYSTNEYGFTPENRFLTTLSAPLSTFAADVDTASYAQLRARILEGKDVPPDMVRVEEMLNYFHYDYAQPGEGEPFGVSMEVADCPWNAQTKLLLIGLQAAQISKADQPKQNLVFLIDVSGSMDELDKLPLVKRAFMLLLDQLGPTDTVSIVTYASRDEVVLDGVPAADKVTIMAAINSLEAGGATAGAAGIATAYELAQKHYIKDGSNRILLATDGDLNVGVSDEGSLARMVSEKKEEGVFLSVLGFGDGNYKDNKLEAIADYGNGNYHYIDTVYEARKALVDEIGGTFLTVCKDVKLQLDFNPAAIKGYRLIGYENRVMAASDFADDSKDGGEIGSGHRVTALYELVPVDSAYEIGEAQSKYQVVTNGDASEWLTLNVRAKAPDGDESTLYTYPLAAPEKTDVMSDNLRFAAAVAEVGMLLFDSEWRGDSTYASALELLRGCESVTGDAYKEEFVYLVTRLERAAQ